MKRSYFLLLLAALFIFSCSDNPTESIPQETQVDMSDFYLFTDDDLSHKSNDKHSGDRCYSMKVLNKQLTDNPSLYNKMYAVEKHTRQFIAAKKGGNGNGGGRPGGGDTGDGGGGGDTGDDGLTINIPVIVQIVMPNPSDVTQAQIESQIAVLNADFNDTDYLDIPQEFRGVASNVEISFTLDQVLLHTNSREEWGYNDAVKFAYEPVSPATHLNIWVCNIGGGILGYAQFPGGDPLTDGIVVGPQFFGTVGNLHPDFNGGRTTTHEVGHWLNLRHIWGDGRCNRDDFVADTPSSDRPNYGCPTYPTAHCRSNDMTMNYMDYTDDACMNMFTNGQKERMRAIFASGGARSSFIN